jgi:hypothetical protein
MQMLLGSAMPSKTRGDIHTITVDARLVVDDIAEVDADAEPHVAIRFDRSVAVSHGLLDGDRTLDSVHNAAELGEDAVSGRVDDATAMLRDHWKQDRLVPLQVADGAGFVRSHERAVAGDVGGQDGSQPALNPRVPGAVCRHQSPSMLIQRPGTLPQSAWLTQSHRSPMSIGQQGPARQFLLSSISGGAFERATTSVAGTFRPFAALQRFRQESEGLRTCREHSRIGRL